MTETATNADRGDTTQMEEKTREKMLELIDLIEDEADTEISSIETHEIWSGDPHGDDRDVHGADICLTCHIDFEDSDSDNPYQVK